MDNDFHAHLDTARLWWELDEPVLVAISEGPSTQDPFREIALYVLTLKRRHRGGDETPALTKIAIRIAGSPALSGSAERVTHRPRSGSASKTLAIVALVFVALAALLTAAAAAELIPIPESVRNVLDEIGIHTQAPRNDSPVPSGVDTAAEQIETRSVAPAPLGGASVPPGTVGTSRARQPDSDDSQSPDLGKGGDFRGEDIAGDDIVERSKEKDDEARSVRQPDPQPTPRPSKSPKKDKGGSTEGDQGEDEPDDHDGKHGP
jgi:hypothetical protein